MMEKLQPKLRFPEFEGNWDINNLRSIIEFKTGFAFQSEKMFSQIKDYQLLKMSNIYKNELQLERNPSYWDKIDDKTSEFLLKKGDCILTLTGTVGKKDFGYSVQIKENNKFLLNQRLVLLRETKNKSLNDFIRYILLNEKFLYLFFNEAKGGTGNQTNVGIDDLKNISLPFPSLPEQQKIASFLTTVDDKISNLKQKVSQLEKYKKGVMQQIFSQQIRFKDTSGNDYPEWEEKSLGEVCKIKTGKLDANAMISNGKYRFYTCAKEYYKIDNYAFDTEALLISGNGANVGYIHYYKGKFNAYQRTYVLDQFTLNIIYVKYFLTKYLSVRIDSQKNEGNTPYIVLSTLSEMIIRFPSIDEQTKIAEFLSGIDEKIETTKAQLSKMEVWKKGLLQGMFC